MVKKPYGSAWPADEPGGALAPREQRAGAVAVSMEPLHSPAAGLVLLLAGELLGEERFTQAAHEAARGAAASVSRTGMVLSRPTFGPALAGGRDEPAYVAPRDATVAALGLMLADLAAAPDPAQQDDIVKRGAARAVLWLFRQQAQNGAWTSAYPADVPGRDALRLVRLDDGDYRNCTYALLLAGDVLENPRATASARRAADLLLRARLAGPMRSSALWATAYSVDGVVLDESLNFPNGADVLASRYAMETLLATYVKFNDEAHRDALAEAARTLQAGVGGDGSWPRFPDPGLARQPSSRPLRGAASTRRAFDEPYPSGTFGLEFVLPVAEQVKLVTPQRLAEDLSRLFTPRQQLAATMVGVQNGLGCLRLSPGPGAAEAFVAAHADWWKLTDGPVPEKLPDRVRRLWAVLLRAKLEAQFGV